MNGQEDHGWESHSTVLAEGATGVQGQLGAVPVGRAGTITEGGGHQLARGNPTDVARERAVSPRRTPEVVTNLEPVPVAEVSATGELERAQAKGLLANRLREENVDVAGSDPVEPHWFWELLAEAGYDVW